MSTRSPDSGRPAVRRLIADRISAEVVGDAAGRSIAVADYQQVMAADFGSYYATGRDVWSVEQALRATVSVLLSELGDPRGRRVLDAGCGHGVDTASLARAGCRAIGVDLLESPRWPEFRDELGPVISFRAGELVELADLLRDDGDIGPEGLDAVLDNGCLHHQHPDRYASYLATVWRLLCPGGLYVVSVFGAAATTGALLRNDGGRLHREFTGVELGRILGDAGFETLAIRDIPRTVPGLVYRVGSFRRPAEPGVA